MVKRWSKTILVEMKWRFFLCLLSGLCRVCKCWWFQSCAEITDWKDVWWKVCCGYILPAECLQEGISVSNLALISNLRTVSFFSSSISWVIVFHIWMQEYPLNHFKRYFVNLFNPTNVQPLPKQWLHCIHLALSRTRPLSYTLRGFRASMWATLFCAGEQVLLFSM